MAYEKHNWQTGEIITEERLDAMEQGIADASDLFYYVAYHGDGDVKTLDNTWNELNTMFNNGTILISKGIYSDENGTANQYQFVEVGTEIRQGTTVYHVGWSNGGDFYTIDPDDYPVGE